MRAEIKSYDSSDIEDFFTYQPEDPLVFAFSLNFTIGPVGQTGADNFEVIVVTPDFLRSQYSGSNCYFLRHYLLVKEYNFSTILALMTTYVNSLDAASWEELVVKIGRVARWEFEDYRS